MKEKYFKRALMLFNGYRTHKLSMADLNKADTKAGKLAEKGNDFKLLIAMAKDTFSGRYKMNKWNLSIIIGTIIYVLSPLDAIPDVIPILGWLDDITIVGYAIGKLTEEMKKYKETKQAY